MKSETSPDPELLQRLVDGELSTDEVKKLLLLAEQNPAHWRVIACELVEDQLFQREFENYADTAEPLKTKLRPAPSTSNNGDGFGSAIRQLTIAAGIAVAGMLGYLAGNENTLPSESPPYASKAPRLNNDLPIQPAPSALAQVSLEPEYQLELLTPDGEAINGEVDLYKYQDVNRLYADKRGNRQLSFDDMLPPSGLSRDVRQRMSRSGYGINESTNYVSGQLEDGRQFVVPVRSIRFDRGH